MKIRSEVEIKCWDSRIMAVSGAELYAEADNMSKIFYKINGHRNNESFMIACSYSRSEMLERYIEVMNLILTSQEELYHSRIDEYGEDNKKTARSRRAV